MMKSSVLKMKHIAFAIVSCVLVMSFTQVCFADHTQLKWGMSINEVTMVMGESVRDNTPDRAGLAHRTYVGQNISDINNVPVTLFFQGNKLISKQFSIMNDIGHQNYTYLVKALTEKYGDPVDSFDAAEQYVKIFMSADVDEKMVKKFISNITCTAWQTKDDNIFLMFTETPSGKNTVLSYTAVDTELSVSTDGL